MSRVGETDTAYGGRDAAFLVTAEANWTDPAQNERRSRGDASSGRRWRSTRPAASTSTSPGSARRTRRSSAPGYGVNYDRLTQLKAKYDRTNLFRMNLNIAPAT